MNTSKPQNSLYVMSEHDEFVIIIWPQTKLKAHLSLYQSFNYSCTLCIQSSKFFGEKIFVFTEGLMYK